MFGNSVLQTLIKYKIRSYCIRVGYCSIMDVTIIKRKGTSHMQEEDHVVMGQLL